MICDGFVLVASGNNFLICVFSISWLCSLFLIRLIEDCQISDREEALVLQDINAINVFKNCFD